MSKIIGREIANKNQETRTKDQIWRGVICFFYKKTTLIMIVVVTVVVIITRPGPTFSLRYSVTPAPHAHAHVTLFVH